MLRFSRINPNKYTNEEIAGKFDFNKTPIAPLGTKALIYDPPSTRATWAPHGTDCFYIGPATLHYRCLRFYCPNTRRTRIGDTYWLYPTHCNLPSLSEHDQTLRTAADILRPDGLSTSARTKIAHINAIHELQKILTTHPPPRVHDDATTTPTPTPTLPPPRVGAESSPPDTMQPAPRVREIHQKHTCTNTPYTTLPDVMPISRHMAPPPSNEPPSTQPRPDTMICAPTRQSQRIALHSPALIHHHALNSLIFTEVRNVNDAIHHVCNGIVHPVTKETITKYNKLVTDPLLQDIWMAAMSKELHRLADGTNTIKFLDHADIDNIPRDRTVTCARIVVNHRPQKEDPNRVRITVGGNLIDYPFELTTRTADMLSAKILWNSVISTVGARFACCDIKNMYLNTPLDRFEYMKMQLSILPDNIITHYNLRDKAQNGFV